MNLKRITTGCLLLTATLLVSTLFITGCRKADNSYYNYINNNGSFSGNTLEYLQSQTGVYDSLLLVITRVNGMVDLIRGGEITLFAANNQSFSLALQNINQARKDSLPAMQPVSFSTLDSAVLDTFLCRYVIPGKQTTDSLKGYTDGRLFASWRYGYNMQMQYVSTNASGYLNGGPKAIAFSDPKNSLFVKNWVRTNTITVDIKTANGIVHLLPQGHDFGFGNDFIKRINKR